MKMRFLRSLPLFAVVLPALASSPGIKNFHQVDEHLYRGGQPTEAGFDELVKMGVKTVIDLREAGERSLKEASLVTAAGMQYINVPMTGLTAPTAAEISKILGILEQESAGAVFVHCQRGADRTGTVIAAYRIDHDHWENSRALSEATALGMSMFQLPRKNFILSFQPRAVEAQAAPGSATLVPALR
jgi:tyrosine-protein phosphatase SIW14